LQPPMNPFAITLEHVDDVLVARLLGEQLDSDVAARLRSVVSLNVDDRGLVLDLSDVEFVDSVGLGALIGLIQRARVLGGAAALAGPGRGVEQVLRNAGCDRIATIMPTVDSAVASLKATLASTPTDPWLSPGDAHTN
jgi:anti-sigma B factor antagonist